MDDELPALASLSLTHVAYVSPQPHIIPFGTNNFQNPDDYISYLCAWLALLPQALCVVYVSLIWATREVEILLMFMGQMGCEAFNFALKRLVKQERPRRTSALPTSTVLVMGR